MFLFTPYMECCGLANCLCIPIDREEGNKRKNSRGAVIAAVGKLSLEQQSCKSDVVTCCF